MVAGSSSLTSLVTFVETEHGRLRRKQRGIDKKDLQLALKYGIPKYNRPRPNGDPTAIYIYNDIHYVVNLVTMEEVTSYTTPLELDEVRITSDMQREHNKALLRIRKDLESWTSNTVLVIDTSGSMRNADVWGTRNRLQGVWLSVALDYVAQRIESGIAGDTDVISVVLMNESADVLIREWPCTWVLYNRIVSIYANREVPPRGHGPFLPSLEAAERLLTRNSNESCAVALLFLSDGKPSDRALNKEICSREMVSEAITAQVGSLAKKFGRQLTFTAVGIGDETDFSILEAMADAAKDYGAIGSFCLPSMTSSSLGDVFTSTANSLTTTQREMTDMVTLKQRRVRQVDRESKTKARQEISQVSDDDFYIYPKERVVRRVYSEWYEGRQKKKGYSVRDLQHPDAEFVAFSKGPFGEGAERFAYRFYEVAADRKTILGKPLVAKESRHILDGEEEGGEGHERERKRFVKSFCETQQLALRLANEFNQKLDETDSVHPSTPRVSFLDCSIYQLDDINLGKLSVLVEERLDDAKWYKWNKNDGYVEGMNKKPDFDHVAFREAFVKLDLDEMNAIEEGSEEEDSDEDDEAVVGRLSQSKVFSVSEVAQAFSHFSHHTTRRKRLVCDLQGVYDESQNVLRLSDPVIHYYDNSRPDRRCVHGRTDLGRKGIAMFFNTHDEYCGHLCRLVNRGFRRTRNRDRRGQRQPSRSSTTS